MANNDVILRMRQVLEAYEAGELRPEQVEEAIQLHMGALECLQYQRIKDADSLCGRLVSAHTFIGEEEFIDHEKTTEVLSEFKEFLSLLPC